MLAEMTDEHSKLFKENSEAAFFSSNQDLLYKIKHYLKNFQVNKLSVFHLNQIL